MTGRALTPAEAVEILEDMVPSGSAGLEGGAELEVFDEEGRSVFLAALARHVRLEESGIIWVRPIVGGYAPEARGGPAYAFDPNVARRRALDAVKVRREGDELVLQLRVGDRSRIRPVTERTNADLERWDSFYYIALTAEEQDDLDRLTDTY